MEHDYIRNDISAFRKWEITIAELYLFFLPFRQIIQLSFLKSIMGASVNWFPSVFHGIGLILWLINNNGKFDVHEEKKDLIRHAFLLAVYLNLSSFIMAIVIQLSYGNHGAENAIQGIIGMVLYFSQYALMFLYNYHVFQILPLEKLKAILKVSCRTLLAIGYVQILVMNGIGGAIYDQLNFLGFLSPANYLPKLCLTGSEGASAGCIISLFVLPFLFSKIIQGERKNLIEVLLWLPPLYYTNSSTAYILATICTTLFIIMMISKSKNPSKGFIIFIATVFIIASLILVITQTGILDEKQITQIQYLLFEKATDRENGSTISRTIPLLVNWGAFKEYPILGVGNGLQGYFYEKYFPDWAKNAKGSDVGIFLDRSREGISNGGIFFPSLLSGYGIAGCVAILIFIWKCFRELQRIKTYIDNFYYCCLLSFACFIVMGFQGDVYGMYYAWFMLSIPFMLPNTEAEDIKKMTAICNTRSKYVR